MRRIAGALAAWTLATPLLAQGLFDDNEARRRVEALLERGDHGS